MIELSLCMITRNEENFLEDCLRSVKGVVNEIIICDTGSTDRTIEIAQDFGAVIVRDTWKNNFSKARNLAMKFSLGKWILHLDADERLSFQSQREIFQILSYDENLGVICNVKSSYCDGRSETVKSIRLFRNGDGLYYSFNVHEQIYPSLHKRGYKLIGSDILIYHVGYNASEALLEVKATRNLIMLQEQRKQFKTGLQSMQIASCLMLLKRHEEAIPYLLDVQNYPDSQIPGYTIRDAQNILDTFGVKS